MGKGIFGFIKWWWRGKLFPEEVSGNPVPISPEVMNRSAVDVMLDPHPFPTSLNEAIEVSDKIAERFEGKPWLTSVSAEPDEKYGYVVLVGINPEALQLKPDEFQYFSFPQKVDDVQVCLRPVGRGKTLEKK